MALIIGVDHLCLVNRALIMRLMVGLAIKDSVKFDNYKGFDHVRCLIINVQNKTR